MPVLPSYREISQLICHARSSYPCIHFSIDIVWLWYITRSCFSSLYHPTMVCCSLITSRKQCSFHKNVIILRCFSKSALFLIYQRLPLNSRLAPVYCIFPLLVSLPLPSILFFFYLYHLSIYLFTLHHPIYFLVLSLFQESCHTLWKICFNFLMLHNISEQCLYHLDWLKAISKWFECWWPKLNYFDCILILNLFDTIKNICCIIVSAHSPSLMEKFLNFKLNFLRGFFLVGKRKLIFRMVLHFRPRPK